MNKLCVIVCYYGKLPKYFPYFLESCKDNKNIDFIIFNDFIEKSFKDQNISFIKSTLFEFNQLASEKTGLNINYHWAYKICEIGPAYGVIFADYLKGYDFWGHCDLDIILGRTEYFFTSEFLNQYDIVSTNDKWMSGSFALYRNNNIINRLYEKCTDFKFIFETPNQYFGFDECAFRWNNEKYSLEHIARNNLKSSIYDIINDPKNTNKIRAHFENLVIELPEEMTEFQKTTKGLIETKTKKQILYFHLLLVKKSWRFYIDKKGTAPLQNYKITKAGIVKDGEIEGFGFLKWKIKRAMSCSAGIYKSIKNMNLRDFISKILFLTKTKLSIIGLKN